MFLSKYPIFFCCILLLIFSSCQEEKLGQNQNKETMLLSLKEKSLDNWRSLVQNAQELGKNKKGGKVKANILYEGIEHKVELKLAGKGKEEWKKENELPIAVKINDASCLNGMKKFTLLPSRNRDRSALKSYEKCMKDAGIITGRYQFVNLQWNDEYYGAYIYREAYTKRLLENNQRKEGLILKFSNNSFAYDNYAIEPVGIKKGDSVAMKNFEYVKAMILAVYSKQLKVNQVFNLPVLNKYFEIYDSLKGFSGMESESIRWYFNPITHLLEPIANPVDFGKNTIKSDENSYYQKILRGASLDNLDKAYQYAPAIDLSIFKEDIWLKEIDLNIFPFVQVDEKKKEITIEKGNYIVDKDLIIPEGYLFTLQPGVSLKLTNNAMVISKGIIRWLGTENELITIFAENQEGQGVFAVNYNVNNNLKSKLSYVNFSGLGMPQKGNWSISGTVTFYQHDIELSHVNLKNSHTGDDCLNIVRGDFLMNKVAFENSFSDAFDGDFTNGKLNNVSFRTIGNDGIDVSGSHLEIEKIIIDGVQDKAISAGENSMIMGRFIKISKAEIGVASKDKSAVELKDVDMTDCRVGFTVFQKKPEFGKAKIEVTNLQRENIELDYLLEKGSDLVIEGKAMAFSDDAVKAKLYGAEYGKASK